MTADRSLREQFSSTISSFPVSHSEKREELAISIRENRERLIELFDISEDLAGCGDWSTIQKEIHAKLPLLTDIREMTEAEQHIEDLLDAEQEMIEGNLRFVLMAVRKYSRSNIGALEEMDFVQEGCEGLLDAVRRFDFSSGGGFLTYALIRIRKRVLLAMEKQQRLVRMPAHVVRKSVYLKEVMNDFANRRGRFPTPAEIVEETSGTIDWSIMLSLSETVVPLHNPAGKTGIPLEEQLPCNRNFGDDPELSENLDEALSLLSSRSKFVLVMRYGLMDGEPHTLAEVSNVLGLSIERIRQIEKASIKLLADHFSGFSISDWLQQD